MLSVCGEIVNCVIRRQGVTLLFLRGHEREFVHGACGCARALTDWCVLSRVTNLFSLRQPGGTDQSDTG